MQQQKNQTYPTINEQMLAYITFIQEYRLTLKPPLEGENKQAFKHKFDQEVLPKMLQILGELRKLPQSQKEVETKVLLYTWQLFNLRGMCEDKNKKLPIPVLQMLTTFTKETFRKQETSLGKECLIKNKVIKNVHICFFNLIKNQQLLVSEIQDHQNSLLKVIFMNSLREEEGQENSVEFQWLVYLFQQCNSRYEGFCKTLSSYSIKPQSPKSENPLSQKEFQSFQSRLLHFVTLLLGKILDERSTTQIVKGYQSPLEEIRKMYCQKPKVVNFKMSLTDYEWIITDVLAQNFVLWQSQLKNLFENQSYVYESRSADNLLSIMGIVNCCIFLGGYNKHLQLLTTNKIMPTMLRVLEISYLLYEIWHANKKSQKVTLQGQFSSNLANLLEIPRKEGEQQCSAKNILPLEDGQMVAILRVFSNLVHINPQAQKYFEQNLEFFRMVMCLTHENERQITMKQWAVVFLRNVAERSQTLREQLEKLKIDIKVDMGTPLM